MNIQFSDMTLRSYLRQLSRREPVPGGGSAAAYTAGLGVGLIAMVARYSQGRKANSRSVELRLTKIVRQADAMAQRLLSLTSLDAKAYVKVSAARKRDLSAQKAAAKEARAVPREVCKLCLQAIKLTLFLVEKGSPYLTSDIEVATELLLAAHNGARVMVRINS